MSHRHDPWTLNDRDRSRRKGIYLNSTRRTAFTKQLERTRAERRQATREIVEGMEEQNRVSSTKTEGS